MIVRINQIDATRAEQEAGWASQGMLGPLRYDWPQETRAFEVIILEQDERHEALNESFRQSQLRLMVPQAIAALREPGEEIVMRLDGPIADGELLGAFRHLTETDQTGRFFISEVQKLEPAPLEVIGSVRIQSSPQGCSRICLDPDVGLERAVRLRAFSLTEEWVPRLMEIESADDDRWAEVLPHVGFVVGTSRGLHALQIVSRRLTPPELKSRLLQRLLAAASAKPAPGGTAAAG